MTDERRRLMFSDRSAVMDAISDPGRYTERKTGDGWMEHLDHWKARAVLTALSAKGLLTVEVPA